MPEDTLDVVDDDIEQKESKPIVMCVCRTCVKHNSKMMKKISAKKLRQSYFERLN